MRNLKLVTLFAFSIMIYACGYNSGSRIAEPVSYLYFSGDALGIEVFIDDKPGFLVTDIENNNHYKVSPGKHLIVIKKNGVTIVKRSVMLADESTKEFNIPK